MAIPASCLRRLSRGGNLGGLIQFRDESLDSVKNQVGQLALVVSQTVNDQNMQGLDQNNHKEQQYSAHQRPRSMPAPLNTGTGAVSVDFADVKSVTASDYSLKYDGSNYTLTRKSDGLTTSYSSLPQTVDGLTIKSTGAMNPGDSFLIKPTVNVASNLSVTMTDLKKIAAGTPVVGATAATTNTGSGIASTPVVNSSYASSPLAASFTLTYDSTTGQLSGFPSGVSQTYTSGSTITVGNVSFTLSGALKNGDQFTIAANTTATSGDNTNALGFVNLQTSKLVGNSTTYSDAYSQLVSNVGNKSNELNITSKSENLRP